MQSCCVPSCFFANSVLAPNGEYERCIWPAARYFSSCFLTSSSCSDVRGYILCFGIVASLVSSIA